MKCVACGAPRSSKASWWIEGRQDEFFKLSEVPKWKSMFGVRIRGVRAYGCVGCGHLQFAVNFSDEDVRPA